MTRYLPVPLVGAIGLIATSAASLHRAAISRTGHGPDQSSAAVHALFDESSPSSSPFPSDRFTVVDHAQATGRRVNLPMPADCVARRSDCEDVALLNQLDGVNTLPRISIPFDANIDPTSVNSGDVFVVGLANLRKVGINQIVDSISGAPLAATLADAAMSFTSPRASPSASPASRPSP